MTGSRKKLAKFSDLVVDRTGKRDYNIIMGV